MACYRRSIVSAPEDAAAHVNLGSTLKAQGKLDEASACFEQAIALAPNLADAHYRLVAIRKDQGRLDEALAYYERTLALNPDHAEAHFGSRRLKTFRRGDPDLAARSG